MGEKQQTIESKPVVIPRAIVGLGNPGVKYDQTRHNIGFAAIDTLAKSWQIPLSENRKFQSVFGEGRGPQVDKIYLLKPLTFMNLSGQAIRAMTDWFKLAPESVLVIYDDMDLPLGKIRLRLSGSDGGHNGMKSTIAHLGTQNFPRLRVGINSPKDLPGSDKDPISHVLGRFSASENQIILSVLPLLREAVELSCRQGVEKAMALYNGRSVLETNSDTN